MGERSRLALRARRGTRELDLILGAFLARGYERLDPGGRAAFARLLDLEEDALQDYFLSERRPRDDELAALIETILAAARGAT